MFSSFRALIVSGGRGRVEICASRARSWDLASEFSSSWLVGLSLVRVALWLWLVVDTSVGEGENGDEGSSIVEKIQHSVSGLRERST